MHRVTVGYYKDDWKQRRGRVDPEYPYYFQTKRKAAAFIAAHKLDHVAMHIEYEDAYADYVDDAGEQDMAKIKGDLDVLFAKVTKGKHVPCTLDYEQAEVSIELDSEGWDDEED